MIRDWACKYPFLILDSHIYLFLSVLLTHYSSGEHSHRSELATKIINEAKADLATFLDIPDDYEVLFAQAGGSGQFSATAYNFVGAWIARKKREIFGDKKRTDQEDLNQPELMQQLRQKVDRDLKLDYIITGGWSQKAAGEAARLFGPEHVNIVTDSREANDGKFGTIAAESTWKLSNDAALVYACFNETVEGVEFQEFPKCLEPGADGKGPIVVADMSSNILSRKIPIRNFGAIFFGAQKNLGLTGVTVVVIKKEFLPPHTSQPSASLMRALNVPIPPIMMQYETLAKNNSLYNTLSIFE
jgi:phosphoserine aminotransferase